MANSRSLETLNLWKIKPRRMKELNPLPSLEMVSTAPNCKEHRYKQIIVHRQRDLWLRPPLTPPYTQSKLSLHTTTNGQSKHAAQASLVSRLGITEMERVNCSVSTCLMTVVRFVPLDSITSVRCSMMFFKKEVSITSPARAVSRSLKSNLRT